MNHLTNQAKTCYMYSTTWGTYTETNFVCCQLTGSDVTKILKRHISENACHMGSNWDGMGFSIWLDHLVFN